MNDMMKEALAKRKGKGLEISVAVGKPEEKTDMAPKAELSKEHGEEIMEGEKEEMSNLEKLAALVKDNPEASALVAKMLEEQGEEMSEEKSIHGESEEPEAEEEDSEEMISGMSDYDKQDVMSREKPRSLMERAQKMALMKGKK